MTPLALVITLILGILIIVLPREWAPIPLLIGACGLPARSKMLIGPFDFTALRILVLFALIRIIIRNELSEIQINRIDVAILLYVIAMVGTGAVKPRRDLSFVYRLGTLYDTLGFYFCFRCWVREKKDILSTVSAFSIVLLVMALEMTYEKMNGFNLFSKLGGVLSHPLIRDGEIRAQGVFAHSILAGTVGATSIGLFAGMWWQNKKWRIYSLIGVGASIVIAMASASTGPIMSVFILCVGMSAWVVRERMGLIRWSMLIGLLLVELFMKSHVWYLMARVDLTGSSTGWHRAELINNAFQHIGEWWLIGTDYTRHWMPTGVSWSPLHTDITNQYLQIGVHGGLISMVFFILIIVQGYRQVGAIIAYLPSEEIATKFLIWTYGATLFSHTITFLSVNYFDQSKMFFFLNIALISSASFLLYEDNACHEKVESAYLNE